jgi:hypothetical protein
LLTSKVFPAVVTTAAGTGTDAPFVVTMPTVVGYSPSGVRRLATGPNKYYRNTILESRAVFGGPLLVRDFPVCLFPVTSP